MGRGAMTALAVLLGWLLVGTLVATLFGRVVRLGSAPATGAPDTRVRPIHGRRAKP